MTDRALVFAAFALLALLALGPLLLALRRPPTLRGRRDPALDLHRAQLAELDREFGEGRIASAEHQAARLEVQRRLLAAADLTEVTPSRSGSRLLIAALILVPIGAGATRYTPNAGTLELRQALNGARPSEEEALIQRLRQTLATMDRKDDKLREGYVLLGNVEAGRGRLKPAAEAWNQALALEFDPNLAAQTAEAQVQIDGKVTPESAALFRHALALAGPDAPWRALAEQRIGAVR